MSFVLGLTGSIGTGKSVAARMLRRRGVPVLDADAAVHRLLADDSLVVAAVAAAFPAAVRRGVVDRRALADAVFADRRALARLEGILHPRVRQAEIAYLRRHRRRPIVALAIPLLFETRAERRVARVILMVAPRFLQLRRVLARPAMTETRLGAILRRQWPEARKRRTADHVVASGLGLAHTSARLARILSAIHAGRQSQVSDA